MVVAHKKNKRAERIKAAALKKHDEGRVKVEATLADLGETKMEIYRSFGELADAIQSIQQRPEYELSIEGIELPSFKPAEFKQLAMAIEAAAGGVGGVAVGGNGYRFNTCIGAGRTSWRHCSLCHGSKDASQIGGKS